MELTSKSIITKIAIVMTALAVTLATAGSSVLAHNDEHEHNNGNFGYQGYAKDQCKKGGWKDLGFKNQGQCVKFFVRVQNGKTCTVNAQQVAELDAFFKVKHFSTTFKGQEIIIQKFIDGKQLTKKHLLAFLRATDPSLNCEITGAHHRLLLPLQ